MSSRLPLSFIKSAHASARGDSTPVQTQGLSLREIALAKLHHANGRFRNPFSGVAQGSPWPVIKWKLFSRNRFKALYADERVVPVSIDWEPVRQNNGLSVTFLKHASVMIKDQDKYLLVDPAFFSPSRFIKDFTPLAFDIGEMPRPHHLLITHGHYDHLDIPTLNSLPRETHLITPLGYDETFNELEMKQRIRMDWFDTFEEGDREITLLPCNHWTMRNPLTGPDRSLWGSYLIKTATGPVIYVSGDTGYFDGFREIGEQFPIDLAIINLGAYEPRWLMGPTHMNPAEAVQAFKELGAERLLIVHWGSYRLGDEPVHLPLIEVRRELEKQGLLDRLVPLNHGETLFGL
ncbi:MAG: MBL fold metallo-hydrolase [Desulfobacterales bacterium]|nr:MBL fold metallo-hydrolase [Desulfobacterales bacterium]